MSHQHNNKEETELQLTGTLSPTLCVNNCGLYGDPATNNMCTSCFRSKIRPATSPSSSSPSAATDRLRSDPICPAETDPDRRSAAAEQQAAGEGRRPPAALAAVNRCLKCRKRVGLTGFRCRCGDLFCGDHRYSDRHGCRVDYKAIARERIQRENPLVRAAKIVRI